MAKQHTPKEILPWRTEPKALVGRMIEVEMLDGLKRTGRVTGERSRTDLVIFDERDAPEKRYSQTLTFPQDFELDSDPGDRIEWARIKKLIIR